VLIAVIAAYVGKVMAKPASTGLCIDFSCNTLGPAPSMQCPKISDNPPIYLNCNWDNSKQMFQFCDDSSVTCSLQSPLTQGACNGQCSLNPNMPCTFSRYICNK